MILVMTYNVFTAHNVQLRHLNNLTKEEIQELLPKVGDRQDLQDAIKLKYPNSRSAVVDSVRHFL